MENFTPVSALLGGALIGLSASLLLLLNGRMAGISGIMNGLFLAPKKGDLAWLVSARSYWWRVYFSVDDI